MMGFDHPSQKVGCLVVCLSIFPEVPLDQVAASDGPFSPSEVTKPSDCASRPFYYY